MARIEILVLGRQLAQSDLYLPLSRLSWASNSTVNNHYHFSGIYSLPFYWSEALIFIVLFNVPNRLCGRYRVAEGTIFNLQLKNTQLVKELSVDAATYKWTLISLTYKLTNQIIRTIEMWTNDKNMEFTNKAIHGTNKHMERYSKSVESIKIA